MDYSEDHPEHDPMDHNPSGETAYPDIDETVHYPWQGSQPTATTTDQALHSVIDPRLYAGLFTGSSQVPDQSQEEEEDYDDLDELSSTDRNRHDQLEDEDEDDYDHEYSDGERST